MFATRRAASAVSHSSRITRPTNPRRTASTVKFPVGIHRFSTSPLPRAQYQRFGNQEQGSRRTSFWDGTRWDTRTKVLVGLGSLAGVYYVAHLEQVQETGRWRFMDVSPKFESQLAEAARQELLREFEGKLLPPNHQLTRHIHRVVSRILEANNLGTLKAPSPAKVLKRTDGDLWDPDGRHGERTEEVNPGVGGREWELMVVNDDRVVNAMASYGNIVVFTGILPVARDEQGLAAVLGHEIGHVVARHNSERFSSSKIFIAFATLLAILGLDFGFSRLLSSLLLELPNSRTQELEADEIGLRLAAKACYNPRAVPEMFSRLGKLEEKNGLNNRLSFLYTHPTSKTRMERLETLLPEAYSIQAATPECAGILDRLLRFQDAVGLGRGSTWTWA